MWLASIVRIRRPSDLFFLENLIKRRGSVRTEDEIGWILCTGRDGGKQYKGADRLLLSALRKVEKRTTLRAEWTAAGSIVTEKLFDYVLKRTITIGK